MATVTVTANEDFNDRLHSIARRKGQRFEIEDSHAKTLGGKVTIEKTKKPQDITMDKIQKDTVKADDQKEKEVEVQAVEKVKAGPQSKALRTGKSGQSAKATSTKVAKITKTKGGKRGKQKI